MRIVDAYPAAALTPVGGEATVVVELEHDAAPVTAGVARLRAELLELGEVVAAVEHEVAVPNGASEHELSVRVPALPTASGGARGYQVRVTLAPVRPNEPVGPSAVAEPSHAMTALLVADHWRHAPRYGFLSEFAPETDADAAAGDRRVRHLAKHHITIVQFYDWMYRHYRLLPPTDAYTDALGRELSLTTVRRRLAACHEHGMAALAYGAVYGPEPEYILERPDWLLYDSAGEPVSLAEIFYITDLRAGSAWRELILSEFESAIAELGFDGIHMDQYGFPKLAYDSKGDLVDLSVDFPSIVNEAAARLVKVERRAGTARKGEANPPTVGVIFNCVNDWPSDTLAPTDQACMYIEVWNPHSRYRDLVALIRRARDLSGKQAILSAYLQPFRDGGESAEWALRYATAIIASAGGHHLVLGEGNGVLRDAYYPDHGTLSQTGQAVVRRYYDHTAAFTDHLHALDLRPVEKTFTTGANTVFTLTGANVSTTPEAGSVYLACSQRSGQLVINLVNLTGVMDDTWDAHQPPAPRLTSLTLAFEPVIRPARITHASPDEPAGAQHLDWTVGEDGRVHIEVPPLTLWSTIVIEHR